MAIPPKPNNPNNKRPLPTPPKKPMGGQQHESESEESHSGGGKRPLPMPPKPGANKPGMPPKPGARPLPTPPKKPGQQRESEGEN